MLEIFTGAALASAAGLNAYIPLLGLGLLSRFTELVQLPEGWLWLENEWALGIMGVLLVIEVIVDKVPALDSVNDVLQTIVRPASGGLVFSAGSASGTVAVTDPAEFVASAQFWPFLLGVLIALVPHVLKTVARPILNLITAGLGAVVSSVLEDLGAIALTILAVVIPVLAFAAVVVAIALIVPRLRRALAARREQRAAAEARSG